MLRFETSHAALFVEDIDRTMLSVSHFEGSVVCFYFTGKTVVIYVKIVREPVSGKCGYDH